MRIGIVTRGLTFDGSTLDTEALGGSETAVASMARALAARGHHVRVFCPCARPGTYAGVEYHAVEKFNAVASVFAFDVLVASRISSLLAEPSMAGLRVLWLHDVPGDPEQLLDDLWQTDLLMGLSDFQIEAFCREIPQLAPHFWKTSNAVDFEVVDRNIRPRIPNKVIFTSRPERGLHYLLGRILPELLEHVPELRLYCCNYPLDVGVGVPPAAQRLYDECDRMMERYPNHVVRLGGLSKPQLYQHISSAQLLLYPASMPEVSCITAMEAQACGTPIITTDASALSETVGPAGVKIPGHPESREYVTMFVEWTLRLLRDRKEHARRVELGKRWVRERGLSWDTVAAAWEDKFESMLRRRQQASPIGVVKELLRAHQLVAAAAAARQHGLDEWQSRTRDEIEAVQACTGPHRASSREAPHARFERQLEILERCHAGSRPPSTLLDYRCDRPAFGVHARRAMPAIAVTLLARDVDAAARLEDECEEAGVRAEIVTSLSEGSRFDVVHVESQLERQQDPRSFLLELMQTYLCAGGTLTFSAEFGEQRHNLTTPPTRLWDFDLGDFEALLGIEDSRSELASHDGRTVAKDERLHGHWLGAMEKTETLGELDVRGRILRARPYQHLSVCMIARDAEKWLPLCLESVAPIADDVHVVDTGSVDGTVEIARKLGAVVSFAPFDNFSQARNASLDMARDADWILSLDADERLVFGSRLRAYTSAAIIEGFYVRQRHLMVGGNAHSESLPLRLWRNRPSYRYRGLVHEEVEDVANDGTCRIIAPSCIATQLDIAHYGYTTETDRRRKVTRNIAFLIRDIQENARRDREMTWFYVMRSYLNIVKRHLDERPVRRGSFEHTLLNATIATYLHVFADPNNRHHQLASHYYQQALEILGRSGLCFGDLPHPPLEIEDTLAAAPGGLGNGAHRSSEKRWVLDVHDLMEWARRRAAGCATRLGIAQTSDFQKSAENGADRPMPPFPDAVALLRRGLELM